MVPPPLSDRRRPAGLRATCLPALDAVSSPTIQALIVFAGERLALVVPAFAAVDVALAGVRLGVVGLLNRQLRATAAESGSAEL